MVLLAALLVWSILVIVFMFVWPYLADHMEDINPYTIPHDPSEDDKTA